MRFGNLAVFMFLWIVPLMALFYLYAFRKREKLIHRFAERRLFNELTPMLSRRRRIFKAILLLLAVTCMILALVRPKWGFHWEEVKRRGVDIMICVDVSTSMLAQDIKPNRLERAKRKIHDLLALLEGDRVGLVAFAGTSFVQCPLTLDYGACSIFLDYLDTDLIPVQGTALAGAVRVAVKSFPQGGDRSSRAIILITDGEAHEDDPLVAAQEAKKEGIRIFAIGIGSESGAPVPDPEGGFKKNAGGSLILSKLDEVTLQKIALETGGGYVRSVTGDLDLENIYLEHIKKTMEQKDLQSTRRKRCEERFQWPLFLAVFLVAMEAWIAERKRNSRKQFVRSV